MRGTSAGHAVLGKRIETRGSLFESGHCLSQCPAESALAGQECQGVRGMILGRSFQLRTAQPVLGWTPSEWNFENSSLTNWVAEAVSNEASSCGSKVSDDQA